MKEIFLSEGYQITMIILLVVCVIALGVGVMVCAVSEEPEMIPVVFFAACVTALLCVVWPLFIPLLFISSGVYTYFFIKKEYERKRR